MKIGIIGLDVAPGKIKYNDPVLIELDKKFTPKKFTPYFFEFMKDDLEKAEAIAILKEKILDLLIGDIEKMETRLERTETQEEKDILKKCLAHLETESPLCDLGMTEAEFGIVKILAPLSLKPTFMCPTPAPTPDQLIEDVMKKAAVQFFYTAGKPEVHSWMVKKDSDIVTCAGKIHTDLARGFIRADITNMKDFRNVHSFGEAKEKGFTKTVDKEYRIQEGDIIEIKFSV